MRHSCPICGESSLILYRETRAGRAVRELGALLLAAAIAPCATIAYEWWPSMSGDDPGSAGLVGLSLF